MIDDCSGSADILLLVIDSKSVILTVN